MFLQTIGDTVKLFLKRKLYVEMQLTNIPYLRRNTVYRILFSPLSLWVIFLGCGNSRWQHFRIDIRCLQNDICSIFMKKTTFWYGFIHPLIITSYRKSVFSVWRPVSVGKRKQNVKWFTCLSFSFTNNQWKFIHVIILHIFCDSCLINDYLTRFIINILWEKTFF